MIKWIEAINKRFPDGEIVLYGVSMGAATVMQASNLDLTENVKGIVEDCGFTSVYEEFKFQLHEMTHLPPFPLVNIVDFYCRCLAGFDIRTVDSRKCVSETKLPMLFIHGNADVFVPTFMCKQVYDACNSKKEMIIYDGAVHAQSHFKHPEKYENDFFAFVEKCMTEEVHYG